MPGTTRSMVGLCLLMAAGCAPETTSPETVAGPAEEAITGGQVENGMQGVVMIRRRGQPHCTGTLIGDRLVLTAGHCVTPTSPSEQNISWSTDLEVFFGVDGAHPVATRKIACVSTEPRFNLNGSPSCNGYAFHDLALITLDADAPASIPRYTVNRTTMTGWEGNRLFYVGYGYSQVNGIIKTGVGTRRSVRIPILMHTCYDHDCDLTQDPFGCINPPVNPMHPVGPWAFTVGEPGHDICGGDSGGPAFVEQNGSYKVAGVSSYGDAVCDTWGVSARVDTHLPFVDSGTCTGVRTQALNQVLSGAADGWIERTVTVGNKGDNANRSMHHDVLFELTGGTGDADLYVSYGTDFDEKTIDPFMPPPQVCFLNKDGNEEKCHMHKAGTYYVKVHGMAAFSGVTLRASYFDAVQGTPQPQPDPDPDPVPNTCCTHYLGGTYGDGACSYGYQCCQGEWHLAGTCGGCTCAETSGRKGCGCGSTPPPGSCHHSAGGLFGNHACTNNSQCCDGAWKSKNACGTCTCTDTWGRNGCGT